ncbi:shikimate dehydrogenase [Litorilituus lipolyticus]|uniref:Shikimate dehydrogenase (NADP(+)) n=1 Tax=Litorilituus lipolyticus TaxID=2491017 RepID=A0A502KP43_9GAMM|nr:shikimate dehydrogenase [Litorilituus lipolyticus]TPH13206.1 shikimate dehydrogenase [Litorilituus lipolyticus]
MDKYLVFGNPIKQSRSPNIHRAFADSTNQLIEYDRQLSQVDQFENDVKAFFAQGGKGANVTAPFKEQALLLSDKLTDRAKLAEAVNTLSYIDGKIYGDNTDGIGLVQDLLRHNVVLKSSNILILGAGGAAKGVILPILEQEPVRVVIANRTVSKAEKICHQFDSFSDKKLHACGFDNLQDGRFDIIINATSASLSGQFPAIPSSNITDSTVCYDMVYGATLTPFLQWAEQQGAAKVIDGLGMLVGQAAESFNIWRKVNPDVESVLKTLRAEMSTAL